MGIVEMFSFMIFPLLYNGPLNNWVLPIGQECKNGEFKWFFTMAFNFIPLDGYASNFSCIGWVWYIANDFQFYLLTPFFILAYRWRKWLGSGFEISGSNNSNSPITIQIQVLNSSIMIGRFKLFFKNFSPNQKL